MKAYKVFYFNKTGQVINEIWSGESELDVKNKFYELREVYPSAVYETGTDYDELMSKEVKASKLYEEEKNPIELDVSYDDS